MENAQNKLIPIARLIKKHTFKENKWKAVALSGLASFWFEKIKDLTLSGVSDKIPAKVEVPLSHSAEFFVTFDESFVPPEKSEILVERNQFPALSTDEFYLCDIIGVVAQSTLGAFRVLSYYENADPSSGLSALSLMLESEEPIKGKKLKIEVPAAILKRKEGIWKLEDLELWIEEFLK